MKTLPDNPNLDHLRQQAKDLLAGLRDSEPGTTLSEAQAALAEQYGFRTWTDLKAEVERRRGHGEVAAPALARAIADRYRLGEVTGPMRSIARADELGRPWSLETDRGRWAVRRIEEWIPIVDVETEVALQEAAAGAGILLPVPVRSHAGGIVEEIEGHQWRVNQWLHSGPPLTAPVAATITRQVGQILATIHGFRLPVDRLSPWHADRFSDQDWAELAATARASHASWAQALIDAIPTLHGLTAIGAGTTPPALVLTHNALGPGVTRLGPNRRLIVFGWEHAGGQPPGWELCEALANWAVNPNGGVNAAGARALLDGYRSVAGSLPALELAAFRGSAISIVNYLDGLLWIALHATDPDQRQHADRSVRHLLAHLPSRGTYERLLELSLDSAEHV